MPATRKHGERDTPRCPETAPSAPRELYGNARMSEQRATIAEAVVAAAGAFTAEELHRALAASAPGIGLATVYRALSAMQDAGSVTPVGQRDGSTLLARCGRDGHHHHLVCTSCGRVIAIDCPLGGPLAGREVGDGHMITRHEITLYGLCADCRAHEED